MRLQRLQLSNYRNFERLDIELPAGMSVFIGDNAQGKSNFLEAVYLLATMRALRAEVDAQLIRRETVEDDVLPAARVVADIEGKDEPLKVEVIVTARPGAAGPIASKTVKINGVSKRLADAVGRLTAVLFTADDLDLITGSPSGRRRYLDMMLSQVDREYVSARSRYDRVLEQRNHLLKRIRDGEARAEELGFWDDELCRNGAVLVQRRASELAQIRDLAAAFHDSLAPGDTLEVEYQPRIDTLPAALADSPLDEIAASFASSLSAAVSRDIGAGMTLQGPHRDDVAITLNASSASGFASRAQQRTIALALRLAESRLLEMRRGEPPVLLLDDILSEMDAGRREAVLSSLSGIEQILVTGTDLDRFPDASSAPAAVFEVAAGDVRPATRSQPAARTADS
jgi:DNA replication and repair protein RecF